MTYHRTPWGTLSTITSKLTSRAIATVRNENRVKAGERKKFRFQYGVPKHKRMSEEDFKEFCEANERHGLKPLHRTAKEKAWHAKFIQAKGRRAPVSLARINMPFAPKDKR